MSLRKTCRVQLKLYVVTYVCGFPLVSPSQQSLRLLLRWASRARTRQDPQAKQTDSSNYSSLAHA